MKRAACCSLVVFTLCQVQCQSVQFVENDTDLKNVTNKDLLTSDSGWSLYDGGQHSGSVQFLPIPAPASRALPQSQPLPNGRRKRRQAYSGNNFNTGGRVSWKHEFHLSSVYVLPMGTIYIWDEVSKRLKIALENDKTFEFLSPKGLRISIPADNINVRIEDFRLKLNEEFGGNDRGNYAPTNYKRGGLWTYDFPDVKTLQGDKVYYVMRVKFIKEGIDVNVNGVLKVTQGNPHEHPIQFRPTATLGPRPQTYGGGLHPTFGGGLGGGTMGASKWSHVFNINPNYGSGLTQNSVNMWQQQAELLKTTFEKINFQFSDPTGLMVSIPDDNLNMRIVDFRLKVNEEFRDNDEGHYTPVGYKSGGLSTYNVPDLKVNQGDRVYFLVRLKLGKEEFDTVVRGVLTITQGDPHKVGYRNRIPPPLPPPQTSTAPSAGVRPGGSSGSNQGWSWDHRFTINTTENTVFTTQEAANRWMEEAQSLKSTVNDMKFRFLYPTGLSISISGGNEDIKVLAFNMKINEEFRGLGSGQFVANITQLSDGRWNYYYPNLKLKQGDKIYYWMRVTQGKKAFDSNVRGSFEVIYGDPHTGGDVADPINSYYPPSPSPYTSPSTFNPYPTPTTINPYPTPSSTNPYPPPSPPNPYPTPSPPNPYPTPSPPNPYPPPSPPNPYPPPSPPNPYPTPSPPKQNSCTEYSLSRANFDGIATPPCKGQIMLQHQFNTLDGWTYQVSIGGKNPEDEFTCFTDFKENTWVQQGRLNIKPTLLEERSNDTFVRIGELHLNGCTLDDVGSEYCHRKAQGYQFLHPVESARISTRKRFTFLYGTVEIRAKLPQGDWLVPELWLEPTNTANTEKIVLGVSTGNTGETSFKLEAGVVKDSDERFSLTNITGSEPWFEGFHTFKLEWTPNNVKFLVDNRQIQEIPTANFPVFSQEVYISLGLHAGGFRDFPDELFPTKPWMNYDVKRISKFWDAKRDWFPTWSSESTFQVEYVKVTAL